MIRRLARNAMVVATIAGMLVLSGILPSTWESVSYAETTLSFQPSSLTLGLGESGWIDIKLNNVNNLYGADIRVGFDGSVVQVLDAIPGDGVNVEPGVIPQPDSIWRNEVHNDTGVIWYVVVQLSPSPPSNGSGTVFRIRVQGIGEGTTVLSFTYHKLSDAGSEPIPHSVGQCVIEVGEGVLTRTPTPTQGPIQTSTPMVTATEGPTESPTVTATPTTEGTATQTATPTDTGTPTHTPTEGPTSTPTATATERPTPIPGLRTFTGGVYEGNTGDRSRPLSGVRVNLWASWVMGTRGTNVSSAVTGPDGRFSVSHSSGLPHYSLIEVDPAGYVSTGVIAGGGGYEVGSERNWVQFLDVAPGEHAGTEFYDVRGAVPTATTTPDSQATATPTGGLPSPTAPVCDIREAERDTFLNEREPQTPQGRLGHLHMGFTGQGVVKTALVRFNLGDVPSGATVDEATFFLFGRSIDPLVALDSYPLRRSWSEYEATWFEASQGDTWGRAGALADGWDIDGPGQRGTFEDRGRVQLYRWDLLQLAQAWVGGARENHGVLVRMPDESRAKETQGVFSREYSELALRPKLVLCYHMPAATPTPTAEPSPTPSPTATGALGNSAFIPLLIK